MKKYFVPSFLQKIDKYLFEKYPVIWETNIHFFIFYAITINLALIVIGFLIPISQKGVVRFEHHTFEYYLLFYIPIIIFASFRTVKNLQFTLYKTFLRFLMCVVITFLWNFTLKMIPNIVYWRVLMIYDKKQVEEDAFYVLRTCLLSDFILKIYFLPEREEYLSTLRKSYFNQHNEIDKILNQIRLNETAINRVRKRGYSHYSDSLVKPYNDYLNKIIKNYPQILSDDLYNKYNYGKTEKIDEYSILNIAEHLYLFERNSWSYNFLNVQNKILFDKTYPCSFRDYKNITKQKGYKECKKYKELSYFKEFREFFCKQQNEKVHKANLLLVEKMLDSARIKKILFEEPDPHKSMRYIDRLKLVALAYWFLFPMCLLLGSSLRFTKLTDIFMSFFMLAILWGNLLVIFDYTNNYTCPQDYFIYLIFSDILLFFLIHIYMIYKQNTPINRET